MIRRRLVALMLLAGAAAYAQEGPRPPGAGRPRDELFKMIDAYIVSNLQESLGLSDEQFVKILPLVKKLQTDRRGFVEKRHRLLQDMQRLLQTGKATEPQLTEMMRSLKTVESDEPAVIRKDVEALDALLTPVQQAKLRIMEIQVERKIRELMNRARQDRPGVRPRRQSFGPDDAPPQ